MSDLLKKEKIRTYFRQGVEMLRAGKLNEALAQFSKAIQLDPHYSEAYSHRSQVLDRLGLTADAEADIRQAESLSGAGSGNSRRQASPRTIGKIDLTCVDNVYEDLTIDADDALDFDDDLYDYVFSDDVLESDTLLDSFSSRHKTAGFQAILEYLNGKREEVSSAFLFEPAEDELTLVHDERAKPTVVSLEQLSCIRLTRVPAGFARNKDANCHVEIIETFDGNIYYESIPPVQNQKNILFGFSTKNDTRFKYTLIPSINIKKRYQRRHLGQILLEKKLITKEALQHVLDEHNELKKIKFGRIIAQQANILYSAVESEIQKAYAIPNQKLKIGEILFNAGLVNEEQITRALAYQKRLQTSKLGNFLIEKGILQEQDVCVALAEKFRIPFVDLRQQKGSRKVLSLLPQDIIERLKVLPLSFSEGTMVLATLLPDPSAICEVILKHSPAKDVKFVLVQPSHLRNVINVLFQNK
jgi:hypothetical protein